MFLFSGIDPLGVGKVPSNNRRAFETRSVVAINCYGIPRVRGKFSGCVAIALLETAENYQQMLT
jgi:hypothetical protein